MRTLSIDDGATLILNLMKTYLPKDSISEENAIYASTQVDGHPYYLYCIVKSKYSQKKFNSPKDIDEIIDMKLEREIIHYVVSMMELCL